MSFATVQDLVNFALKASGALGVGQSASAEDSTDAFNCLNGMLGQWQRKRWMIWHLIDVPLVSTGAMSYTVGPGGDFNVPRPDRLEAAFFRQLLNSTPNHVDYPLQILEAREDYNQITIKNLTSFPNCIFYDAAFPVGTVYPWPVPQAATYELHLTLKEQLAQFTGLSEALNLPLEYEEAIWSNLAGRLSAVYQIPPNPAVVAIAKASMAVVRGANAQIPRLTMPQQLTSKWGLYNIFSDNGYA